MADKKYFSHKTSTDLSVGITADGYLELSQPNNDDEIVFHITASQAARLTKYIQANLNELWSGWANGESGDK